MIETKGDMWQADADAFVITTNGFVKKNGEAVMGRGCAKEAATFWPWLPRELGKHISSSGNVPHCFWKFIVSDSGDKWDLITFPVKHNWWEKADIELIKKNAFTIGFWAEEYSSYWKKIAMPRPGCGNGQLNWKNVKPILEKYLDDRFIVYDY